MVQPKALSMSPFWIGLIYIWVTRSAPISFVSGALPQPNVAMFFYSSVSPCMEINMCISLVNEKSPCSPLKKALCILLEQIFPLFRIQRRSGLVLGLGRRWPREELQPWEALLFLSPYSPLFVLVLAWCLTKCQNQRGFWRDDDSSYVTNGGLEQVTSWSRFFIGADVPWICLSMEYFLVITCLFILALALSKCSIF